MLNSTCVMQNFGLLPAYFLQILVLLSALQSATIHMPA